MRSEDAEQDMLDFEAADHDTRNHMDKIEAHLRMERKILEAWNAKDDLAANN